MKTKKITAVCMAAGLTLLGTAGVIAYASGNPYETYKSAVVSTISEDNLTAQATVQMKQNGKVIASGYGIYEKSAYAQYANVTADVSGNILFMRNIPTVTNTQKKIERKSRTNMNSLLRI